MPATSSCSAPIASTCCSSAHRSARATSRTRSPPTRRSQPTSWRSSTPASTPSYSGDRDAAATALQTKIEHGLEQVAILDEDRILRRYLGLIKATLRTNAFQRHVDGSPKDYLSFKVDPAMVPDMPLPRPAFEIFVYGPAVEGVHLRGGKVARGGLRWSDRREDFRTEMLGLMKAQMVKNGVIVPVGAKGGFFVKRPPETGDRQVDGRRGDPLLPAVPLAACSTSPTTRSKASVVPPAEVVRYDDDDPYLVVAADKGTATFSDIANAVSRDYGFWLDDAFASGGSAGYDHKGMGITARGAWESVKRHFRELGLDPAVDPFTVIGIGDMSGDVFGNGMLLSDQIRLLAAFDHRAHLPRPRSRPGAVFRRAAAAVRAAALELGGLRQDPAEPGRPDRLAHGQVDHRLARGQGGARRCERDT